MQVAGRRLAASWLFNLQSSTCNLQPGEFALKHRIFGVGHPRMPSSTHRFRFGERFDENGVGELFAERQPCVADLADKIGLPGQQLDLLIFAKSQFAEAVAHVRFSGKVLDANHRTSPHPAEWADLCPGTMAFQNRPRFRWFLHRAAS